MRRTARTLASWARGRTLHARLARITALAVFGAVKDGKPALIACVTDDLVKRGLNAGAIVRQIAGVIGGSGGGKPNLAQAGGKDPARLGEALAMVRSVIAAAIK